MSKAILSKIDKAKKVAAKLFSDTLDSTVKPEIEKWLLIHGYSSVEFSMGTFLLKKNGAYYENPPKTHDKFMNDLNQVISYDNYYQGEFEFFAK